MSGEATKNLFNNPIAIGLIIAAAIIAVGLIIWLIVRSRRGGGHQHRATQAELLEMERENQFVIAAEHIPSFKDVGEASREAASHFRDYLGWSVLAIYAGRERDDRATNVLGKSPAATGALSQPTMPDWLSSTVLSNFLTPQVAPAYLLAVDAPAPDSFTTPPTTAPPPAGQETDLGETQLAPPRDSMETQLAEPRDLLETQLATPRDSMETQLAPPRDSLQTQLAVPSDHEVYQTADAAMIPPQGASSGGPVIVFPWRASFDWRGLIVAVASQQPSSNQLARLRDPIGGIADRLAVALEFQRERAAAFALDDRASRALDFSRDLIASLDESSPLASIARAVASLVGANSSALWRVEPSAAIVRMVASHGLKSAEFLPLPMGQGLAGTIAETREPLALEDAPADPRCIFPREARESGIGAYLGVPVIADDQTIGVVEVHSPQAHPWNDSDMRALTSAAQLVAQILKSTDMRGNRLRVESAYLGLSEALQRLRSPDEVIEAVVEVLGHALGVSRVLVVALDDKGQPLPVRHEYAAPNVKSAVGSMFRPELSARLAASDTEPIAINDSTHESLIGADKAVELQLRAEMGVPVRIEGSLRAVLYLHQTDRAREWAADEIEFADRVARQLSLSLANVRALDIALREARAAREEAARGSQASSRIHELEKKLAEIERVFDESRSSEAQARVLLAKASAGEAKARAETEVVRRSEAEAKQERDRLHEDVARFENSAQQLLDVNRLKSEFIVNAGREIEGSLQSVLGMAELLERGSYGALTEQQHEAVREIYNSGRRIKADVDWLIEYGATRSRRLEEGGEQK
jgi:GAF domain-containing protein